MPGANSGALKLDRHRGNCSTMVANVAAITECVKLQARLGPHEEKRRAAAEKNRELKAVAGAARHAHEKASALLATRRTQVDALVAAERTHTKAFAAAAADHHRHVIAAEAAKRTYRAAQGEVERSRATIAKLDAEIAKARARIAKLEPMPRIRQLDVAQDTTLMAAKLTGTQLILYASREYLSNLKLTPQSFVARVFSLKGRRAQRRDECKVVFYRNSRDGEVTTSLEEARRTLNARKPTRDGRRLRYALEDAPKGSRGAKK